ncbi:dihydroxy-acid dehydratase [uncultured Clostridium sp.]|uniref:dihydroxy-acid dehydratase n=1 Tax=uncultured Clostridium sp. TaxID=59620 RepID=UPI0025FC801E|nr:dihydroxy-acid dehydratase [uncultured Clostridium sp.]
MDESKMQFSSYRSGELINGIERSAHRALLYSTGLDTEDFGKPLVAVVNSFTEMVPGHIHLRELADYVKQGIIEAGGIPREFNTIALCDGICQGHKGMSYPLPSREIIADSIEMMIEAHHFDAMVILPGCDKIVPGMIMAAARVDIPTIIVPGGPMLPGRYKDMDVITLTDMRELIGKTQKGELSEDELLEIEKVALPTYGTCAMLGTANSMSCLAEILGLSLPHCGTAPAVSSEKRRIARNSGKRIVQMIQEGLTARKILTRDALLNGIAATMAMGASTNTVLHLMSIANEAGVHLELNDFDRISREVPYICNLKPSGKYPIVALHEIGGLPAVLKAIEGKLKDGHLTVTGKTLKENLKNQELVENDIIYPLSAPKNPEGGIAILYGTLAPDGAVVKKSGVKPCMYQFEGRARVFHSMEDASYAVSNDLIQEGDVIVIRYEGPKGGPGMREMHMTTSLLVGRGMDESCALVTDGRFSGSTRGPCIGHISPEAAEGGPIAAVEEGDRIRIDIPNRRLDLLVPQEVIEERLKHVVPVYKERTPSLAKYASLVTSADKGAILRIEKK